jgi:bifunctional oligoribonuclease and PAP phosphatase NrnA
VNFTDTVNKALQSSEKIAIISHVNPDGDAMGASLSLYGILKKEKNDVTVIIPNEFPSFLAWMPFSEEILIYESDPSACRKVISEAEVIFCVDFNDVGRIDGLAEIYKKSKALKFLIDHHLEPAVFTDHTLSVVDTSSTSEIIYDLILALGKKNLLDKAISECLYVGIVTDTGSFSYSCNRAKTYEVIAELFKYGIDGEHIHRLVYDTFTENRMRLLGYCLSEKMKVISKYDSAYISLTKEDLAKFNYQTGDTEGVVNYALSVAGIELAALFMEREGHIKVSLRSKGKVSVNDMARKYYKGGGHHNAAGGYSYTDMSSTLKGFEKLLPEYFNKDKK